MRPYCCQINYIFTHWCWMPFLHLLSILQFGHKFETMFSTCAMSQDQRTILDIFISLCKKKTSYKEELINNGVVLSVRIVFFHLRCNNGSLYSLTDLSLLWLIITISNIYHLVHLCFPLTLSTCLFFIHKKWNAKIYCQMYQI